MKDPLNRTKVVIRHLPWSLSQTAFFEQIDSRFSSRYSWCYFLPGKSSYKNQKYARAYMNFNSPDDVFEFAEFFNGHVFVNEKGAQFKAIVEYAPSQRVPKLNIKKDGREGTIYKDPEYIEFLERISKPAENLPSADIQLERREAERAGIQEAPVVTPLMEFVRKRRAAKTGNQHVLGSDVKSGGRSRTASPGKSRSSRRASEKKYILKSTSKNAAVKDKSTHILVSQRENQMDASGKKSGETDSGNASVDTTKKKILLLKVKEQDISQVSDGTAQLKPAISATEASPPPGVLRLNQRHDASGRIIRSILLNKDARQNQSSSSIQMDQKLHALNPEKGKRPPRAVSMRSSGPGSTNEQALNSDYVGRRSAEDKSLGNESHGFGSGREKQDRCTRSRERLDRGVWTPLRHEYQTNAMDSCEAKHGESKVDNSHTGFSSEVAASIGGRNSSYADNGPNKNFGRRGPSHSAKEDGSSKRGGSAGHGLHEKQVWVQRSASGS